MSGAETLCLILRELTLIMGVPQTNFMAHPGQPTVSPGPTGTVVRRLQRAPPARSESWSCRQWLLRF
jgi:hypothetical protein